MEVALEDFDNDGFEDVAVRFRSLLECGSHGCHTQLYHARAGAFDLMDHNLVTDGPIARCRSGSIAGVAFPGRGRNFVCFMFPGWTDKDIDPSKAVFFQGSPFSLLEGSELSATLLGHSLQAKPCNDSSQCYEAFFDRGRYSASEDRGVIHGSLVIKEDRYCAGWDDYEFCAAVYRSSAGQLATTNLKCGVPCLRIVERREVLGGSELIPPD